MIDLSTKEFGFELYQLKAQLNSFSRKKIYKVDKDGTEWFRYSKPHHDISYDKFVYVGKRETRSYGEVDDDRDIVNNFTEYFFKNDAGEIEEYRDNKLHWFDVPEWYETESEVKEQVIKMQLIGKEIDRQ